LVPVGLAGSSIASDDETKGIEMTDLGRCGVCGWPIKPSIDEGCELRAELEAQAARRGLPLDWSEYFRTIDINYP